MILAFVKEAPRHRVVAWRYELSEEQSVDQSIITRNSIVAVLIIDKEEAALPTARALASGGVMSIELTLRTEAALDAIAKILGRPEKHCTQGPPPK